MEQSEIDIEEIGASIRGSQGEGKLDKEKNFSSLPIKRAQQLGLQSIKDILQENRDSNIF